MIRGGMDRLRALLGRDHVARDIDAEFDAHLAHRIDDFVAEGLDPAEARRRAESMFGDRARLREASLSARARTSSVRGGAWWWTGLGRDLALAVRQFRRAPGFATVAGLTLMLGIGATVAIVSVVRAVVLDPLPFDDPDQLVMLEMRTPRGDPFSTSEPAFLEWRERADAFVDVGAFSGRTETLRRPGEPRAVVRGYGSAGLLEMLGLAPVLGRAFTAAEDAPGSPAPVALLGHDLWQDRFGGEDDVVGRSLDIDGRVLEVIGVLPVGTRVLFGRDFDVLTPLAASMAMDRGEHYLDVVARLKPGVETERAEADLAAIVEWQSATYPTDQGWSAAILPADEALLGRTTIRAGWVLLAAAILLLGMTCLNVSNLLLARATTRRGELGIRAVLGAGRGPLLRQLCAESVVLAGGGSLLGLGLAAIILPLVRRLGQGRIPRLELAGLDPATVAAVLAAVVAAIGLFGVMPVLGLRRGAPITALRGSGRGSTGSGAGTRRALVGIQVAMSVVLLVGTGLLFRSFVRLARVDPGFEPAGTLTLPLAMPDAAYTWEERGPLLREILRQGRAVPGIEALGATAVDPFSGLDLANFVARDDRMPERAADFTPIQWRVVTPGFFEAMGMELQAGRAFVDSDSGDDVSIVIDERLAARLYDTPAAAVGRVLVWGDPAGSRLRIVGVAEGLRDVELAREPTPMVYRSHQTIPWASMTLVARVRPGATSSAAAGLREAVAGAAPGVAVPAVRSLATNVDRALAQPRFNVLLLAGFAGVGFALAVVGLYGLTAFEVRGRFREIGIRMSLGADGPMLVRSFVCARLVLASMGLAAGLILAVPATRWLDSLLFETPTWDPLTWLGVIGVVVLTSAVAAWIPARRASRVDPREVLSAE